jgi:EamA domain-containing membrane protein RarD
MVGLTRFEYLTEGLGQTDEAKRLAHSMPKSISLSYLTICLLNKLAPSARAIQHRKAAFALRTQSTKMSISVLIFTWAVGKWLATYFCFRG